MPVIHILNPQDPIPEVKSSSSILDGAEVHSAKITTTITITINRCISVITNVMVKMMMQVLVDLNEDSWASAYFVIFFHSGANHPGLCKVQMNISKLQCHGHGIDCIVPINQSNTQRVFRKPVSVCTGDTAENWVK